MAKHNRTGRSKGAGRFIQVHEYVLRSPGWRRLSPLGRCAWLEFNLAFNGSNNGKIAFSSRALADRLDIGATAAANAIRDLINCGFLERVRASDFGQKKRAAEYRLTHLQCDVTGEIPSKKFLRAIVAPVEFQEAAE